MDILGYLDIPARICLRNGVYLVTLKPEHALQHKWRRMRTESKAYLEPAATLDPLLLKVTWFALVVNRVRMPSGSPSGKVWIWTVLLETAVTNFPFCREK